MKRSRHVLPGSPRKEDRPSPAPPVPQAPPFSAPFSAPFSSPVPDAAAGVGNAPQVAFRHNPAEQTAQIVVKAETQAQLDSVLLALSNAVSGFQGPSPNFRGAAGRTRAPGSSRRS